jgi:ABC-type transporter MlaC component
MKKILLIFCLIIASSQMTMAQTPWQEIIKAVINAADLVIQQVQNETIVLQNAEKEITNVMSELQLNDITDWVQKQKDLYQEYYNELATVKDLISGYDRLKGLVQMQGRIVSEYESAYNLFKQDKHFTGTELDFMFNIYSGIVDQSLKNLDQALLVVSSLETSMTDAERMNIIESASEGMQKNYDDLKRFNNQNIQLSLKRSQSEEDIESVKQLYGIQ